MVPLSWLLFKNLSLRLEAFSLSYEKQDRRKEGEAKEYSFVKLFEVEMSAGIEPVKLLLWRSLKIKSDNYFDLQYDNGVFKKRKGEGR